MSPSLYETLQCILPQVMACCVFLVQELIQKAIDCALEAKKSWERMSFEARYMYMCTWGWGCMRGGRIMGMGLAERWQDHGVGLHERWRDHGGGAG